MEPASTDHLVNVVCFSALSFLRNFDLLDHVIDFSPGWSECLSRCIFISLVLLHLHGVLDLLGRLIDSSRLQDSERVHLNCVHQHHNASCATPRHACRCLLLHPSREDVFGLRHRRINPRLSSTVSRISCGTSCWTSRASTSLALPRARSSAAHLNNLGPRSSATMCGADLVLGWCIAAL